MNEQEKQEFEELKNRVRQMERKLVDMDNLTEDFSNVEVKRHDMRVQIRLIVPLKTSSGSSPFAPVDNPKYRGELVQGTNGDLWISNSGLAWERVGTQT